MILSCVPFHGCLSFGQWTTKSPQKGIGGLGSCWGGAAQAKHTQRFYRIGPASRPYTDQMYSQLSHSFKGNGLRPFAPAFLQATVENGDLIASWIRRSRSVVDGWNVADVPIFENQERYQVKIWKNGALLRETFVTEPQWTYSNTQINEDGATGDIVIQVAQMSDVYGPGLFSDLSTTL